MSDAIKALIHQWREEAKEARAGTAYRERENIQLDDGFPYEYCADQLAAALHAEGAPQQELTRQWRELLIEADSMLSAAGHGRAVTKEEQIALSGRIRDAYEKSSPVHAEGAPAPPQPDGFWFCHTCEQRVSDLQAVGNHIKQGHPVYWYPLHPLPPAPPKEKA